MLIVPRMARSLTAAAALALAVLAPSVAAAHSGHAHAPQVTAPHAPQVTAPHAPAAAAQTRSTVAKPAMQELTAAQATPAGAPDAPACTDRGCCTHSACGTGFSIVAPVVAMIFPASAGSLIHARDGPARPALAAEGPKRPPKLFA